MKICLGNITLNNPVILAPMSGVTDLPFRKLVKTFGASLVVSEMVASRAMISENKKSLQKSAIMLEDEASCVQISGCEPNIMAEAAKINEDMGAKIIDINFGCPAKKIVGAYAGSALMKDEKLATKILEAVIKAVKIPVTLKMRTGWDYSNLNAPALATIAEKVGIQMITIHGRTRCQFYSGKADWSFIKEVKKSVKIPVIVNGDITSCEAAIEALAASDADGIMVGRGTYGKPWLIKQIMHYLNTGNQLLTPTKREQIDIITSHYDSMLEYYGIDSGIKIARKHLGWYSKGLHNSSIFRAKINTSTDHKEIKYLINQYFE